MRTVAGAAAAAPGLCLCLAVLVQASAALTFSTEATTKSRPMSQVIDLLKGMLKQLEIDASEDEAISAKMDCWCETNDKEKTTSIIRARARITRLTTKSEASAALLAQLGAEIKKLEPEVARNQGSLAEATSLREKQVEEFNGEEKDLLGSISALKAAITVLGKHRGVSLMQMPEGGQGLRLTVIGAMQRALQMKGVLLPAEHRAALSLLQEASQAYVPQPGQILGILEQMGESFEANLATAQEEEKRGLKAYGELKAANMEEITAGKGRIEAKAEQHADAEDDLSRAKADLEDTAASLTADEQFLAVLKEKCQMTKREWEERKGTRQAEMGAVSKALSVLSGDEAHDLFTRTFVPTLTQTAVQRSSFGSRRSRQQAAKLLSAAASKLQSPRLVTLAYQIRLDAFTQVKKAVRDMIKELIKEKADEIKHKDFCINELQTNQLQTERKKREKEALTSQAQNLESVVKTLSEGLGTLKSEVAEMQVQLKHATQDRERQNREFQTTVADQRATRRLLKAALEALEHFYGEQAAAASASFAQSQEPPAGPPPRGFEAYAKSASSGGVLQLIQQIASDAQAMESEAIRSEEDAQKAYEAFVKETNVAMKAKRNDMINKSEDKAKTEDEHVEAKKSQAAAAKEMDHLGSSAAELHRSCDFVLKNFGLRQTSRDEEVEALRQAEAILSGAKFEHLLQTA